MEVLVVTNVYQTGYGGRTMRRKQSLSMAWQPSGMRSLSTKME